uniref:NPD002 n=1 Tax=Homo sapiens TaxID=9606 RepID=Q9UNZ4_HUMAN|nr:NPD002 [Homo sapiens]
MEEQLVLKPGGQHPHQPVWHDGRAVAGQPLHPHWAPQPRPRGSLGQHLLRGSLLAESLQPLSAGQVCSRKPRSSRLRKCPSRSLRSEPISVPTLWTGHAEARGQCPLLPPAPTHGPLLDDCYSFFRRLLGLSQVKPFVPRLHLKGCRLAWESLFQVLTCRQCSLTGPSQLLN